MNNSESNTGDLFESVSSTNESRYVFHVGELTNKIRTMLEGEIGEVWVEGEVSNLRVPSSGHTYFTLKDEGAQIEAVWFARQRNRVRVELRDGMQIRVFGLVTIYEKSSQYQIRVERIEEVGRGNLYEAFEKLKAKLKAEGLFDRPKKPIPLLPQHIGIITSRTGAAYQDMIKVLSRRFPNVHILLAPVRVQGEGAAQEIADALDRLSQLGGLDVIIVGRGGGSIEDLWCFNEEVVARAIARSKIPVISAVGHETDFTISDFVADVRAPTPSAAAEMVVGRKDQFQKELRHFMEQLRHALIEHELQLEKRLVAAEQSYVFREPENLLRRHWQTLDHCQTQMKDIVQHVFEQNAFRLEQARGQIAPLLRHSAERIHNGVTQAAVRVQHAIQMKMETGRHRLNRFREQLVALNPECVLQRGYSITRARGVVVRDAAEVDLNEEVEIQLARGQLRAEVRKKEE